MYKEIQTQSDLDMCQTRSKDFLVVLFFLVESDSNSHLHLDLNQQMLLMIIMHLNN